MRRVRDMHGFPTRLSPGCDLGGNTASHLPAPRLGPGPSWLLPSNPRQRPQRPHMHEYIVNTEALQPEIQMNINILTIYMRRNAQGYARGRTRSFVAPRSEDGTRQCENRQLHCARTAAPRTCPAHIEAFAMTAPPFAIPKPGKLAALGQRWEPVCDRSNVRVSQPPSIISFRVLSTGCQLLNRQPTTLAGFRPCPLRVRRLSASWGARRARERSQHLRSPPPASPAARPDRRRGGFDPRCLGFRLMPIDASREAACPDSTVAPARPRHE